MSISNVQLLGCVKGILPCDRFRPRSTRQKLEDREGETSGFSEIHLVKVQALGAFLHHRRQILWSEATPCSSKDRSSIGVCLDTLTLPV